MLIRVHFFLTAILHLQANAFLIPYAADSSQLTVGNTQLPRRCSELHTVSDTESSFLFAVHRNALLTARIVGAFRSVLPLDSEPVTRSIDAGHSRILTFTDTSLFGRAAIPQYIAYLVACRPHPVCAGEVLPWHKHLHPMLFFANNTSVLQLSTNGLIDLNPRAVIRRYSQRFLRRLRILLRDRRKALRWIFHFMHPALPLQSYDGLSYLAACELLDYLLQLRIFLTHDLIELHRLHTRVLELREDAPRFDGFMLARVAHQQDTIIWMKADQKLMHLLRRCQRRLVQYIEALFAGIRLSPTRQVHLEGRSLDSCLT